MAYVNEYASDEDIEKYKLNEVWDRYHPHEKDDRFWGRKPELTIDRDRDVFLMVASSGTVSGGTQFKFLLSIGGEEVFVYLNLVEGSSPKFYGQAFLPSLGFRHDTTDPKSADIEESEISPGGKKSRVGIRLQRRQKTDP